MLEIKLEKTLNVNTEDGYNDVDVICINYAGHNGLLAVKRMQDTIYKSIMDMNANQTSDKASDDVEGSELTKEQLYQVINVSGNSEALYKAVINTLPNFAKIGTQKVDKNLIDRLTFKDIENIVREVTLHFLLGEVIQTLTNT